MLLVLKKSTTNSPHSQSIVVQLEPSVLPLPLPPNWPLWCLLQIWTMCTTSRGFNAGLCLKLHWGCGSQISQTPPNTRAGTANTMATFFLKPACQIWDNWHVHSHDQICACLRSSSSLCHMSDLLRRAILHQLLQLLHPFQFIGGRLNGHCSSRRIAPPLF
jgi:hypothetical protein